MSVLQLEIGPQALAHDRVVVGDEHADHGTGTSSRTVVPAPGADTTVSVPPSAAARSSIEVSPSRRPRASAGGIEPAALVGHAEHEPPPAVGQAHRDARLAGVAQGVLQRLLRDPQHLAGGRLGELRRLRQLELDRLPRDPPQHVHMLAQRALEPLLGQRAGAQREDDRAQLLHRAARQHLHALDLRAGGRRIAAEQRDRRLGGQHDAEQLLHDGVVELAREPVALLDDAELAALLVQPGVLDRDRRVRGQQPDQPLVGLREDRGVHLVGQVERADDAPAGDDRHAQERAHLRMRRRPPAAEARVGADVGRAVGLGRLQHRAEQAVRARQRAHGGDQVVAHPGRDEAGERPLAVGHPERGVARVPELARRVDDPLQHRLDLALGRDREHHVRQCPLELHGI